MKIAVVGVGHLASATRENCGKYFELNAIADAELVWFCVDTPVDEHDVSDVEFVLAQCRETMELVKLDTPVLISSQLPVGTCARIEEEFPDHILAVQPENIRKAHAVEDFADQVRMIVGIREGERYEHAMLTIQAVLDKFTWQIYWMSPESAEMCKHVLNTFLAMEIAFANEMADLCELVGAEVGDVFAGFRSDHRVGHGPLIPGKPYAGGTLGRDVKVLRGLAEKGDKIVLFPSTIAASNGYRDRL